MSLALPKTDVTCPHCGQMQAEAVGVISTVCRKCHQHFQVSAQIRKKIVRAPKETRSIVCFNCEHEQQVVAAAWSAQCEMCSTYLNFRDMEITDESREVVRTYGRVIFAAGCDFRGASIRAGQVQLRGRVRSKMTVDTEIVVGNEAQAEAMVRTPRLVVERRARSRLERVEVDELVVEGSVRIEELVVRRRLWIKSGGALRVGRLECSQGEVERGAILQGRVILRPTEKPPVDVTGPLAP